jgi:hypothetical protein
MPILDNIYMNNQNWLSKVVTLSQLIKMNLAY